MAFAAENRQVGIETNVRPVAIVAVGQCDRANRDADPWRAAGPVRGVAGVRHVRHLVVCGTRGGTQKAARITICRRHRYTGDTYTPPVHTCICRRHRGSRRIGALALWRFGPPRIFLHRTYGQIKYLYF